MLFSAKFSGLEKRFSAKSSFYIAHSSPSDRTSILFFEPKDEKILETLNMLCEHNERLKYYVFKVTYQKYKTKTGSYQSYFNVIGFDSSDSPG